MYHLLSDSAFGSEDQPTFFMHKKHDRSYHIDYVFAPNALAESLRACFVGTYEEWIDASDHMPIIVEFED